MGKRGGHGKRAKRVGRKEQTWDASETWNAKYLAAFVKESKRLLTTDPMSEDDRSKIALLVGAKAIQVRIRPEKAGILAAHLCEDFDEMRAKLMRDLIENPGILESVKKVMRGEGEECDDTCDCGANEDQEEAPSVEGETADA